WSISMAHAESSWSCQPAPNGGFACAAKPIDTTAAKPTAPTVTAPVARPAAPATSAQPAVAAPTPAPIAAPTPVQATQPMATAQSPTAPAVQKPAMAAVDSWDWVPNAAAGQCCKPNGACDGAYVEPPLDWEDADKSPKHMPARANAAHSEWEGDTIKMDGGVTVTQGNLKLTADRADLNRSTNQVNLYGDVVLHQP